MHECRTEQRAILYARHSDGRAGCSSADTARQEEILRLQAPIRRHNVGLNNPMSPILSEQIVSQMKHTGEGQQHDLFSVASRGVGFVIVLLQDMVHREPL